MFKAFQKVLDTFSLNSYGPSRVQFEEIQKYKNKQEYKKATGKDAKKEKSEGKATKKMEKPA